MLALSLVLCALGGLVAPSALAFRAAGPLSDLNCDFHNVNFCNYTPDTNANWQFRGPSATFRLWTVNCLVMQAHFYSKSVSIPSASCLYFSYYVSKNGETPLTITTIDDATAKRKVIFNRKLQLGEGAAPKWVQLASALPTGASVKLTFNGGRDGVHGAGFANITAVARPCGK